MTIARKIEEALITAQKLKIKPEFMNSCYLQSVKVNWEIFSDTFDKILSNRRNAEEPVIICDHFNIHVMKKSFGGSKWKCDCKQWIHANSY